MAFIRCKILLLGDYSLDAIDYYLDLIEIGVKQGFNIPVKRIYNIDYIEKGDLVITIDAMYFTKVWLYNIRKGLKLKIINWFQGIVPEEAMMIHGSIRKKWLWEIFEIVALKASIFSIFVSDAMIAHYNKKYKVNMCDRSCVIPCFNKQILPNFAHPINKYNVPNFVYAGSLSKWQCINETLMLYKMIETEIPEASISLLTSELDKAKLLIEKYKIVNYCIKHVELKKLDLELRNYKYGFLIRENNKVNNVATPTKMNSYLAMGIIPIYTNVIVAFEEHINLKEFSLKLDSQQSIEMWAKKVINFERNTNIVNDEFFSVVSKIFKEYYNDNTYYANLSRRFKSIKS